MHNTLLSEQWRRAPMCIESVSIASKRVVYKGLVAAMPFHKTHNAGN
jgi:hypothetical protein